MKAKGILLIGIFGGIFGCARQKEVVVAEVMGSRITQEDVRELAQKLPSLDKRGLLWTLIDREILIHEARARGLDRDPEILERIEKIKRVEMNRLLRKKLSERIKVSEDEAKRYYEEKGLSSRQEARARHIMVRTEEEAEEILKKLKQGEDFAELAKKYSLDRASAEKGGDLGWWREGEVIGPTARKIFSMKVGEISEPFKDPQGYYHIIEVLEKRPIGFERQKKLIVNRIKAEKIPKVYRDYMEGLKKEIGLEVEPGIVDSLLSLFSELGWKVEGLDDDRVVLRYEGGEAHLKDYISWLRGLRPKPSNLMDSLWVARSLDTFAVDWVLVPYAAKKEGIERSEWLKGHLDKKLKEMMAEKLKRTEVDDKLITPDVMREFYDKYKELYYLKPPQASINAVRLDSLRWAEEALERIKAGEDVEDIARDYPLFHGRYQNWGKFDLILSEEDIRKKEWLPYIELVKKMKVGEVGGPIKLLFPTRGGEVLTAYVAFKVVGKEPEGFYPLNTPWVQRSVRLRLKLAKKDELKKLYKDWMVGLRAKYKEDIKVYEDKLESLELPRHAEGT